MADEEQTRSAVLLASGAGPARCSGALADLAVADVLQLLQLIGKSAVMTVTVAHEGVRSRLWCAEGSLIDAESGRLRGEPAAYRILALDDGWLEAELRQEQRPRTISAPTQRLLLEAARRKDETLALRRKLGGVQCCYRLVHEPEPEQWPGAGAPSAAEQRLLQLLAATPSLGELLAGSELGDLETLTVLARWFEAGYLARVGTRAEPGSQERTGALGGSPGWPAPPPLPAPAPLPQGAAAPSAPLPSVPPLAANVPPEVHAPRTGRERLARIAASSSLLALASFSGGYLLRGSATSSADGAQTEVSRAERDGRGVPAATSRQPGGVQAGAPLPVPVASAPEAPAAGSLGASGGAAGELPAQLPVLPPEVESSGAAGAAPVDSAAPPAPSASSARRPASRREPGRPPAASPAPSISEPRVRVIGATEPSVRVLD